MNDNTVRRWVASLASRAIALYGIKPALPVVTLDDYFWYLKGVRLVELRQRLEQHAARWR